MLNTSLPGRRNRGSTPRRRRHGTTARPARAPKASDRLSIALASGALAKLIGYFAVRPDSAPHLRSLMRETELGARSVQMELVRLEHLGLVARDVGHDGRVTIRAINQPSAWAPFRELVRAYANPVDLLRLALADIFGVTAAFVFGSVARETADAESDVDLFVVAESAGHSEVRRLEELITRRAVEASLAIGREVNVVVRTAAQLNEKLSGRHRFYEEVLAGPKRWVIGDLRTIESARRAASELAPL